MSSLRNAYVKKSPQVLKQYLPVITKFNQEITPEELATIKPVDIHCVEVQIPETDWDNIVKIVEAHERTTLDPVMADAWNKYLMTLRLRQT